VQTALLVPQELTDLRDPKEPRVNPGLRRDPKANQVLRVLRVIQVLRVFQVLMVRRVLMV
jgi:hypothetical protein